MTTLSCGVVHDLHDAASTSGYIASMLGRLMDDELRRTGNETVAALLMFSPAMFWRD